MEINFELNTYRLVAIRNMKRSLEHIEDKEDTTALAKFAKALSIAQHSIKDYRDQPILN